MHAVPIQDTFSHSVPADPGHGIADRAIFADLARLFGAGSGQASVVQGGATRAWRRLLGERLATGDTVLVPRFGPECDRLAAVARELGLVVETVEGARAGVPYGALCRRLRDDVGGRISAVLVPAAEAATGEAADIGAIRALMDRAFHDALLLVDATEVLGTGAFDMARWGVDVAVADCRTGPVLAEGLALVAVSDAAAPGKQAASLRLVGEN